MGTQRLKTGWERVGGWFGYSEQGRSTLLDILTRCEGSLVDCSSAFSGKQLQNNFLIIANNDRSLSDKIRLRQQRQNRDFA